jgi:AAA family ATP:ADP antiporter
MIIHYFSTKNKEKSFKLIILGLCFFFIIGAYTVLKELKDAIFSLTVGCEHLPEVKIVSLFMMIPFVMFYTWLSTKLSKDKLVAFYALFFSLLSIIIGIFVLHPEIGLQNFNRSSLRLFGWITYLLLEGLSPFLVSLNWSFLSALSSPQDVKTFYVVMAGAGKAGALIFSLFSWMVIMNKISFLSNVSDSVLYAFFLFFAAFSLFLIPLLIFLLQRYVSKELLMGYSEKYQQTAQDSSSFGLQKIISNNYVLGIVGMMFFWEIINVTFNNLRLVTAFSDSLHSRDFLSFLFYSTTITSIISFLFILLGTNAIIRFLGTRIALLLIPLLTGFMMFSFVVYKSSASIYLTWMIIRVINLSLATPVRESMYIVTSKTIQFKTKSWIDSFGQKCAKGVGSLYVKCLQFLPPSFIYLVQGWFLLGIIVAWFLNAYFLGSMWEETLKEKRVVE